MPSNNRPGCFSAGRRPTKKGRSPGWVHPSSSSCAFIGCLPDCGPPVVTLQGIFIYLQKYGWVYAEKLIRMPHNEISHCGLFIAQEVLSQMQAVELTLS